MSVTGNTAVARRPTSGTLAEVVDIILDKGLVIDAYVRVSLVGIELLTIDIRVVVASVDTYLHFAEAVNRLDLRTKSEEHDADLQDLIGGMAGEKTEGAMDAAGDKTQEALTSGKDRIKALFGDEESDESEEEAAEQQEDS